MNQFLINTFFYRSIFIHISYWFVSLKNTHYIRTHKLGCSKAKQNGMKLKNKQSKRQDWLRLSAIPASVVPDTQVGWLTAMCNLSCGGTDSPFCPLWYLLLCSHIHMNTHTLPIIKIAINL